MYCRGVRAQVLSIVVAGLVGAAAGTTADVRRIAWRDIAPLASRLEARGITAASFPAYLARVHEDNARRVREGDLDHLVFYLLQSTHFTADPPIEPALSAKDAHAAPSRIPPAVRSRITALARALDSPGGDARLGYFRVVLDASGTGRRGREAVLAREYQRVMAFLYEKEFVAQRAPRPADAVAELYRARGLSTDTAVEAGYVVYLGLGIAKSLEPEHRIRRVLIIGPGLDLAPRTGFIEAGPPESYQPWAVIDALLWLGLSRPDDLEVVGADINPRVVQHLRRARAEPPTLTLVTGIRETPTLSLAEEYHDYFTQLGRSIGTTRDRVRSDAAGHLRKTVPVAAWAARALSAATLDIVTDRLDEPPFDLIIATNILPYFDDVELMLAMSNVAKMLAPGGVLLHNEARPLMHEVTAALGMPVEQSRHAIIASVTGAPAPLFDSVWLHRKAVR